MGIEKGEGGMRIRGDAKLTISAETMVEIIQKHMDDTGYKSNCLVTDVVELSDEDKFVILMKEKPPSEVKP